MTRRGRAASITVFLVVAGFLLGVAAMGGGSALGLLFRPSDLGGVIIGLQAAAGGVLGWRFFRVPAAGRLGG